MRRRALSFSFQSIATTVIVAFSISWGLTGCSGDSSIRTDSDDLGAPPVPAQPETPGESPGETTIEVPGTGGDSGSGDGDGDGTEGPEMVCESTSTTAELLPVFLYFVFDVSGSMGKIADSACYDPEFKWHPVVAATTAFFESPDTEGLFASMRLFPAHDDKCDALTYQEPDVASQALPSVEFRNALSAYEAEVVSDKWRGGTPTLAALTGAFAGLEQDRNVQPPGQYAIVLVTDGKPEGCDDADIVPITAQVRTALGAGVPTYVIGVKQPTSKPGCELNAANLELQENLDVIALEGGTGVPFMIDTTSPASTETALTAAIQSIRERSDTCTSIIPPHPSGGMFEKDKVDVSITESGVTRRLDYDPDCLAPEAWHYDNEESPQFIKLCDPVCALMQADPASALQVNFLCEPRVDVVR